MPYPETVDHTDGNGRTPGACGDKQTAVELARSQAANDAQARWLKKMLKSSSYAPSLVPATEKELAVTQAIAAVEKTRDSDVQARDAEMQH